MKKYILNRKASGAVVFRRWGGEKYSLFQALNREVRIAVLVVSYLMVAGINETFAQTDSLEVSQQYNLDEIEVSAQRAPVTYSQVARIVSVIDREQIEAAPVNSVQDLLEYALGVDIRQRGANGVQADVSIRGGSFDQTLILLNGINISDPQTGHHNLNLPVSLKNIKRIEILEGPAARVYGPNAFSGAINIVTEPSGGNKFGLDLTYGEHQLRDANVSANKKLGKLDNFVAFNNRSSAGYINNTDFDIYNFFYHGRLHVDEGRLDMQFGYSDKAFGANSFYSAKYPNQFEQTKTTFAALKFETGKKLHFSPAIYWRRNQDRFELFRHDSITYPFNYHLTDVLGTSINSWFKSSLGKTAFGTEFRSENIWSSVLGEPMSKSIPVPGEKGHFFTHSHSRTTVSFFAEHTFYLGNFTASGGAMANWISDLNYEWNIYPGVDASYQLADNLKVYGSYNKSLRMPTFTDLYYNGPTNKGNPDLKPERSSTIEGGFKWNSGAVHAEAGYYHRDGKDLIDWVRKNAESVWETKNLTEIKSDGVELIVNINLPELVGHSFFINRINTSYSYNTQNKVHSDYLSNYALDNLKHKFVLTVDHKIWKNLQASWDFRYQERNGTYEKFVDRQSVGFVSYEPFWLTDVKVFWKTKKLQLSGSVSNLFDKSYVDLGNIQQPGRWIKFGVKYQIDFD